jgi:5-methylcytosine-specific restriction endonuclease McrA
MKKIFIDNKISLLAKEYSNNLFNKRKIYFEHPILLLEKLKNKLGKVKHKQQIEYIDYIIAKHPDILKANPSEIKVLIQEFEAILPKNKLTEKIISKKKSFYENIVDAMRYDAIRSSDFLPYLNKLNIRTCVYCHSQFALVVDAVKYDKRKAKNKKYILPKALVELDHFYPKSKYPYLATSFFNLYPVCGSCNRAKSSKDINYEIYSETVVSDDFKFWIDDISIINFWITNNLNELEVNFENLNGDYNLRNEFNEIFAISGIYSAQKDVAEELLYKAKIYTKHYKEGMLKQFASLISDKDFLDRLIIGNYSKEEDILKRPLAKFTQDIASQLGLI